MDLLIYSALSLLFSACVFISLKILGGSALEIFVKTKFFRWKKIKLYNSQFGYEDFETCAKVSEFGMTAYKYPQYSAGKIAFLDGDTAYCSGKYNWRFV